MLKPDFFIDDRIEHILLPGLQQLRKLFEDARATQDPAILHKYDMLFLRTIADVGRSNSLMIKTEAAKLWLDRIALNLDIEGESTRTTASGKECLKLLKRPGIARVVANDSSRTRTLAYVCLTSLFGDSPAPQYLKEMVRDVLEDWVGHRFSDKTINSMESVINRLYGPSAWTLFRSDVVADKDVAIHLYASKVDVLGLDGQDIAIDNKNIDLPDASFD